MSRRLREDNNKHQYRSADLAYPLHLQSLYLRLHHSTMFLLWPEDLVQAV